MDGWCHQTEGDLSLSDFDISEDYRSGKMQLVKEVVARRPDVRLFGSPWSAPAWVRHTISQNHLIIKWP